MTDYFLSHRTPGLDCCFGGGLLVFRLNCHLQALHSMAASTSAESMANADIVNECLRHCALNDLRAAFAKAWKAHFNCAPSKETFNSWLFDCLASADVKELSKYASNCFECSVAYGAPVSCSLGHLGVSAGNRCACRTVDCNEGYDQKTRSSRSLNFSPHTP